MAVKMERERGGGYYREQNRNFLASSADESMHKVPQKPKHLPEMLSVLSAIFQVDLG